MSEDDAFKDDEAVQEFISLTMALWNDVGHRFEHKFFMPMFLKDEADNILHGNNWTIGFMRGMDMHINDWLQLMHDEEEGGILLPIMALAHEHDPDPELRSYKEPVSPELREKLLHGVTAGATLIYEYFAPQRITYAKSQRQQSTVRHEQPKTGRNDPCPCGSGLKYKKCCGRAALH